MSYHDSALLQKISVEICQSIIAIQQQQPELLIAKYRTINWQISTNKSALSAKLKAGMNYYKNCNHHLKQCLFPQLLIHK
jgi:predicted signal transduction protein with EAL and GGDEF domain